MSECHYCHGPRHETDIMLHRNGLRICGHCVRRCVKAMKLKGIRLSTRDYQPRTRRTEIHLLCPGCETKLRIIRITPPAEHHCPICDLNFMAEKGPRGRIILSLESPEIRIASSMPNTREEALTELRLSESSGPDDARKAYRQLCQLYHPDKVAALGPELRELAEAKMKRLNEAYALLQN